MRRRYEGNDNKLYPHVVRYSASTSFDIPSSWARLDMFIVGGGGSGGAWYTWKWSSGGGGTGGQCVTFLNIPIINPSHMIIDIGPGGASVATGTNSQGRSGGDTVVTITNQNGDNKKYTALGGSGGTPSQQDSADNNQGWDWRNIATKGYDERSDSLTRYHPDLNNSYILTVCNARREELVTIDTHNYPLDSAYLLKRGVPEFHENGNPTHAAGGTCFSRVKPVTDFQINGGGNFSNTGEGILQYGGGGYGGGGAGSYYRSGSSGAGGAGGVVIRYWDNNGG